jgi:hypothetical protein
LRHESATKSVGLDLKYRRATRTEGMAKPPKHTRNEAYSNPKKERGDQESRRPRVATKASPPK